MSTPVSGSLATVPLHVAPGDVAVWWNDPGGTWESVPFLPPATAASTYVAKAGDTMTGPLRLPNNVLVQAGDTAATYSNALGMGSDNHLYLGNTAYPTYLQGSSVQVNLTSGAGYQFVTTVFQPGANNNYHCGYGALAWNEVVSYAFNNASDIKHKTDIEPLPDCLGLVAALNPKRFKFINGPDEDRDVTHWGFVAQDVAAVVGTGKDFGGHRVTEGEQFISYHELTAILWKACQEMAQEIAELKKQ